MTRPLLLAFSLVVLPCAGAQIAPGNPQQQAPAPGSPAATTSYPSQTGAVPSPADPGSATMMSAAVPPTFAPVTDTQPEQTARGPVRISGSVMATRRLTDVSPVYPAEARQNRVEGAVVLVAMIGKNGAVESLRLVSGPQTLADAAIQAVKQWTYKPYVLNGQTTEVLTTVTVHFQLGA